MKDLTTQSVIVLILLSVSLPTAAQVTDPGLEAKFQKWSSSSEKKGLADPFKGITQNGILQEDLFKIASTGVSTKPVMESARSFLALLDDEQLERTQFEIADDEWRKWMNQHFYRRQGTAFFQMTSEQREAAFGLMTASLSAKGLKLSTDIMKLDHTLGEINNNFQEYGELLYYITVMGKPSPDEPWGWQLEGHHLIINYFVLGDQVVMTPFFVGSEPVIAESGQYQGVSILQDEQNAGLEMLRSLDEGQRQEAILQVSKNGNNNLTEAFRDNVVIDYAGVKVSSFSPRQKDQLTSLIKLYVDNMDEGHARIKMEEVAIYLDDTWFAWIGGTENNSVYYYRIHSPVVLIEFDHQKPVGTRQLYGSDPHRQHIHAVVRTPNGNDYGKDLLRQHYEQHPHK